MMNKSRIKQVSRISGVPENLVEAVITAELLRLNKELLSNDRKYATGIYGDIVVTDPQNNDVCELKSSQELIDMFDGNYNPSLMENIR